MDTGEAKKGPTKPRKELPEGAVATLKAWLLSPEHFSHPYPTPQQQMMLMQKTGIDNKQLKNWFTNARRRIWKPMLKKQLEEGKTPGGLVAMPPGGPGGAGAAAAAALAQQLPNVGASITGQIEGDLPYSAMNHAMELQFQQVLQQQPLHPLYDAYGNPTNQTVNVDSHAVLMELFARDQDLVRQATEGAKLKARADKEG